MRQEVARALKRGKKLLPVLIDDTPFPSAHELPEDVRDIASLHAERLRFDRFERDAARILMALSDILDRAEHSFTEFQAMMRYQESLEREDPEAAKDFGERWLGRAKEELPRFESRKAPRGMGNSFLHAQSGW